MTAPQPTTRAGRSDGQLLRAAHAGDRDSWQDLVDRYADTVWDLAERLVGAELAVGVSELVWLRLAAALPAAGLDARLSLWLHRTVWEACTRHSAAPAWHVTGS
jgi:DNA-directed RNA polymerase specialized sigma24 family protein